MTKRLLSVTRVGHAVNVTSATAQPRPDDPRGPAEPPSTAARLLDAAAGAFADKGFHATTTRDIASRAGLSPAGVYVHFASKEGLLHALSTRGHEQALAVVSTAPIENSPTTSCFPRIDTAPFHA